MTVDRELRKIWKRDLEQVFGLMRSIDQRLIGIELDLAIHHPKIGLPPPVPDVVHLSKDPPT